MKTSTGIQLVNLIAYTRYWYYSLVDIYPVILRRGLNAISTSFRIRSVGVLELMYLVAFPYNEVLFFFISLFEHLEHMHTSFIWTFLWKPSVSTLKF